MEQSWRCYSFTGLPPGQLRNFAPKDRLRSPRRDQAASRQSICWLVNTKSDSTEYDPQYTSFRAPRPIVCAVSARYILTCILPKMRSQAMNKQLVKVFLTLWA